jgi:hypothetical protein
MGYLSKNSSVVYVTEETTEGIPVDPSLGLEAVRILGDGFELSLERETIERTVLTSSISKALPRAGMKTATGSIGLEAAAALTAGLAPDGDLLFLSALGAKRSLASTVISGTGHTTTSIKLSAGTVTNFAANDILMLKEAGAFHVSPITAVNTNVGAEAVTLLVPTAAPVADACVIEKFTQYYGTDEGHPSLTITGFMGDAHKQQAVGCFVNSLALESYETGQIPNFTFGVQGLDYTETLASSGLTASFGDAEPPTVLGSCVYRDGALLDVTALSFSVENTLGTVMSTCSPNGKIAQKITERAITGSFTTYMSSTSVDLFNSFNNNTQFSLFFSMHNPTAVAGEKKQVVSVYIPNCVVTAMAKADADGLMQYNVEFSAGSSSAGVGSDLYVSFI